MAYDFYLGEVLLPVPPKKTTVKIQGANKTYNLINTGEVNVLKDPGLTEIEFEALLPNTRYPFAVYKNDDFKRANYFLAKIEKMKIKKQKFQFIVSRTLPNGELLFDTNIKCTLEDYKITEDASSEGFDVLVSISLKQYRDFGVKRCKVKRKLDLKKFRGSKTVNIPSADGKAVWEKGMATLEVEKSMTLGAFAKQVYGDDSLWTVIRDANCKERPQYKKGTKSSSPKWKKSTWLRSLQMVQVPLDYYK